MTKTIKAFGLVLLFAAGAAAAATTHTVVKGDHLWGLAGHYYKNNYRWQAIYAANQDKIKDPHWIYPGQVFAIPDLPSPEVGELPAEPLPESASAPVQTAPEEAAAAPEAAPAEAPAQAKEASAPPQGRTDDLSVRLPEGQSGMYPSMVRVSEGRDWKEDGRVTAFEGREILAAPGDSVVGVLNEPATAGSQFEVYRKAAQQELDQDSKAKYLQRVGLIKVTESLGKNRYRFLIVQSADPVETGDLLKKKAS